MAKIKGGLVLPSKPLGPEKVWTPVARRGSVVPWGYIQDEEDSYILQPVPEQLELLDLAKKYLKEYSYREIAHWISTTSGRYISHVGLRQRIKIESKRETASRAAERLEKEAKEVAERARKIANTIGGTGTSDIVHPEGCSCPICTGNV